MKKRRDSARWCRQGWKGYFGDLLSISGIEIRYVIDIEPKSPGIVLRGPTESSVAYPEYREMLAMWDRSHFGSGMAKKNVFKTLNEVNIQKPTCWCFGNEDLFSPARSQYQTNKVLQTFKDKLETPGPWTDKQLGCKQRTRKAHQRTWTTCQSTAGD